MRTGLAVFSLTVTLSCFAGTPAFDLLEISHLGGKGRIQDQKYHPNDPQVTVILAMGQEAVPLLIEALQSERQYDKPPLDFWPKMVEGDVALLVLSDLFLDPTWLQSTLPELCWDNLLERTSDSATASDLLSGFVKSHGRSEIARRWRDMWAKYGSRVHWNAAGQYFQVEGRELTTCAPNKSLERTRAR